MNDETPSNRDVQTLWTSQPAEGIDMSLDEIRSQAAKFRSKIHWRNLREYAACLLVVVFFGFQFWHTTDALTRAGFGLIIAGMMFLAWQLYQRGSSQAVPAEMGLASGVEYLRRELERQRDLVKDVWRWYLGPLVPGLTVAIVAMARANPHHLRHNALFLAVYSVAAALAFVAIGEMNRRAANRLQRRIDELSNLKIER